MNINETQEKSIFEELSDKFVNARNKFKQDQINHKKYIENLKFKREQDKAEAGADLKDFMSFYKQYPGAQHYLNRAEENLMQLWKDAMNSGNRDVMDIRRIKITVLLEFIQALKDENKSKFEQYRQFFESFENNVE